MRDETAVGNKNPFEPAVCSLLALTPIKGCSPGRLMGPKEQTPIELAEQVGAEGLPPIQPAVAPACQLKWRWTCLPPSHLALGVQHL